MHSPTQTNFSPSRSRQTLSNQYHFNIKVHFHPPENPKKPPKKCQKLKKLLQNVKEFAQTHSTMWRPTLIDRSRRALSIDIGLHIGECV